MSQVLGGAGEGRQAAAVGARMRAQARALVAHVTRRNRLPLDYSVASLRVADFMVEGLRKGSAEARRPDGVLYGLGAYVGEVLVRQAGGVWVELDGPERELIGQAVGIRMPDGRVWNPLGKVVKRFESGPEESLHVFYLTLHGRARKSA